MIAPRRGVGLHTGVATAAWFSPATAGAGLIVRRRDLGVEIPVRPEYVRPALRCTCLERDGARVETVEHALAALVGLGILDAVLEVEGPELPLLDGSALPWVEAAREAGLAPGARRRSVRRPVELAWGGSRLALAPGEAVSVRSCVAFDHPGIGRAEASWSGDAASFVREIAPARTFALLEEIEPLRAAGRIRGGTLEGAVVLGPDGPLNPEGLRFPDEPARHKLLDLLGDLALAGGAPLGRVDAERYGHGLVGRLLREAPDAIAS